MPRLDPRSSRGLTLIEMMVALVVSSIVALGIFAFASIQQTTSGLHTRSIRVQQALDGAMWSMSQDLRTAGLGFARSCTELRIWDQMGNRLINPGAYLNPAASATRDGRTGEAYWVLRDGIQAQWNSSTAGQDFNACRVNGPDSPSCAADTFDVIMGERNYVGHMGTFIFDDNQNTPAILEVITAPAILNPGDAQHVAQVQQLFPPGSFVVIIPRPRSQTGSGAPTADFAAEDQRQCPVLQITGDVVGNATADNWQLPIGGVSFFNSNLTELFLQNGAIANERADFCGVGGGAADPTLASCPPDLQVAPDGAIQPATDAWVVPLGRLRWSRYAVDYTATGNNRSVPYLVRYDLIGFNPAVDPSNLGSVDYPSCAAGTCRAAGLHLPDHNNPPLPVAIGPMIEDMQVAVGCDGWSPGGVLPGDAEIGFVDPGAFTGPLAGLPNLLIDEHDRPDPGNRQSDEWLGNAKNELWAPDCVFYGTGDKDRDRAAWVTLEGNSPPPNFRMSPQTVRITLIGAAEELSAPGGMATDMLMPIEDRPVLPALAGMHERYTLTERFTPRNLRWRDPTVP